VASLLRRCCGGAVCWRPAIEGSMTPPATAMSIEEREAAIRQERARRLSRHPGLSPQEKASLQEWDERDQSSNAVRHCW
jgi:hypothetical protein